ncbi:(Dimethylallyl)adenosine tRNA methylthiotransferase MiaB, partial [human gut metagenome]
MEPDWIGKCKCVTILDDQIPEEIKRVRLQTLMDVQNEISYELNKPMEGQVFDII